MTPPGASHSTAGPSSDAELPLRLGITTPVLTLLPGGHASWEVDAGIDEVEAVATTADALGYYHLTLSLIHIYSDRVRREGQDSDCRPACRKDTVNRYA